MVGFTAMVGFLATGGLNPVVARGRWLEMTLV